MDRDTKLAVFQELIQNSHELCYCSYTPDLHLISSNQDPSTLDGMTLLLVSMGEPLLEYSKHGHLPFRLDSFLHIQWIADFEWEGDTLQKIHVIGPMLTNPISYQDLKKKLDERDLSVYIKHAVTESLNSTPIVANNIINEYVTMLHYCITGEHINGQDYAITPIGNPSSSEEILENSGNEHLGIWPAEQQLLSMLRDGNPNYKEALSRSSSLSFGVKHQATDPLRQCKNNLITLLTLISRAAIEGGLNPAVAYDLNDYYMQKIEDCQRLNDAMSIQEIMMDDYVTRVRQCKSDTGVSKAIQNICNYISVHINEKLSTKELAERTGYTEYYFSRKFKQEMGCGIREYITKEKIERAKMLLSSTNMSILDISLELSFSSRSYFSDTFQRICGISPAEYRKQTLKI